MEKVICLNLSQDLEKIAEDMVKENKRSCGNYTLEEADEEMVQQWIQNAKEEGDMEYAEHLEDAINNGADILLLEDTIIGDVSQTLGEVIVY